MKPGPFTTASLVANALSLGPHWIYNLSKIARLYPEGVVAFTDPQSDFHPNRKAGDPGLKAMPCGGCAANPGSVGMNPTVLPRINPFPFLIRSRVASAPCRLR